MTTRPAAPPAPAAPAKGGAQQPQKRSPARTIPTAIPLNLSSGLDTAPDRIVIFGTGGIGKSTLAAWLPGALFLDTEKSTKKLPVTREYVGDWPTLRGKLAAIEASPPKGVRSVVIDTASVAEEFAREYVIETRRTEKGNVVDSIEGYGWGKGWKFVYEEFNGLLADLDRLNAKGLIVCLVCHVVAAVVPHPAGDDFLQWQPALYPGDKKGDANIRNRIKNWAEQVLFIGYDVFVPEGSNKAQGSGTRTIYTTEQPTHIAKTRSKAVTMAYDLNDPGAIWRALEII